MEKLVMWIILLFLIACSSDSKLTKEILFKSRQNIYMHNSLVSLVMNDRWREDCELFEYDKDGKLVDRMKCFTDPVPIMSYLNDSTLILVYNVSVNDSTVERDLKFNEYNLKNIKVKTRFVYNYQGEQLGEDLYYDFFKINKKRNLVDFFLENKLVVSLKTEDIISAYGKLEFIEYKNNLFIYRPLLAKDKSLNIYYTELIRSLKE